MEINARIKVCHIHTDPKFDINIGFKNNVFDNRIYYLLNESEYNSTQHNNKSGIKLILSRKTLRKVVDAANECDLIVLYMLNNVTAFICNRVRKDVLILWRFYGAELYGKVSAPMYSELTLSTRTKTSKTSKTSFCKIILEKLKLAWMYEWNLKRMFSDAIKRIDAVAMLYRQEYDYLNKFFDLPKFIQLPYNLATNDFVPCQKNTTIIIGNSRNSYNNHLDILEIIKDAGSEYRYEIPFNYGMISSYSKVVEDTVQNIKPTHLIKDFMPYTEYQELYKTAAAFVQNAYRQMAMGNVFIALSMNVKIYLNIKNSAYWWLKSEGCAVFSIEDFINDIKKDNVYLSQQEIAQNKKAINSVNNKYTSDVFRNQIFKLIRK